MALLLVDLAALHCPITLTLQLRYIEMSAFQNGVMALFGRPSLLLKNDCLTENVEYARNAPSTVCKTVCMATMSSNITIEAGNYHTSIVP